MKQAIFFILDDYADWEGAYLANILNQNDDWQVKTASTQRAVTSLGGFKTTVDFLIQELPPDFDLLILVGGNSWGLKNHKVTDFICQTLAKGIITGAICGAVDFLAENGLLTGYNHTGNAFILWKEYPDYQNADKFIEEQAVRDANLITANGTAPLEFTQLVLKAIEFADQETIEKSIAFYQLGFYQFCKKYGSPF